MRTRAVIWHSQSDAHAAHGYALPTTGEIKKFGLARGVSSKNANGMPGSGTLAARWTCLAAHGPQADTGDRDSWSLAMRLTVRSREAL